MVKIEMSEGGCFVGVARQFFRGKGSDEIAFELLVLHFASVCLTSRIVSMETA